MFGYNRSDDYFKAIQRKRFRPSISEVSFENKSIKTPVNEIGQSFQNSFISNTNEENKYESEERIAVASHRILDIPEENEDSNSNIMRIEDIKDDSDYGCIIALTENRAREVGFACISLRNFSVELTQISDTQTYSNTLTLLHNYCPIEIVMPLSLQDSGLCLRIKDDLPDAQEMLKFIQRKLFNEEKGIKIFEDSCTNKPFINIDKKYVVMACLAGLHSYCDLYKSIVLESKCLEVNFVYENERMNIDFMTAQNLELTFNLKYYNCKYSLCSLFKTETEAGKRLLRTNILNPLK